MTVQITAIIQDKGENYYMVAFDDHAERSRWLLQHDFEFSPVEGKAARWTSNHNGIDYGHSLELVPFAPEHSDNLFALCMKCYVHPIPQKETPHE